MLIPNKRAILAGGLRATGLLGLLGRLARRPGLVVLGYHRVASREENPFFDGVISADPDGFRRQVAFLRDHFRMVGLDDLLGESPHREPSALITFDDGYRDNVEAALPILRGLGVPAAFFLPTGFLGLDRLFWWDKLAYILKTTHTDKVVLDGPGPMTLDLEAISRDGAIARAVPPLLAAHPDEVPRWVDHLAERSGVAVDEPALARSLLMGWDGARALLDAGMAVGSHAITHRALARLSPDEQRDELAGSKAALEAGLGREVPALAYPFGVPEAVDEATRRIAVEAGYRVAFAFEGGVNRPGRGDPMALARINVGLSDDLDVFRARALTLSATGRAWV